MTVYLHGIVICNGSDNKPIRFRKLNIPFKSLSQLEKFRMSRERIKPGKRVYTMHSFSKNSDLFRNRPEQSVKTMLDKKARPDITKLAEEYLKTHTKQDLADIIGIDRVTIYARLNNHRWKKSEIYFITRL